MLKDSLAQVPRWVQDAREDVVLPFAYEEVHERFWALLDDEELEEAFREFRVDAAWPR